MAKKANAEINNLNNDDAPVKVQIDTPGLLDTEREVVEPTTGQGLSRFVRTLAQGSFITLLLQMWQAFGPDHLQMNADEQALMFTFIMACISLVQVLIEDLFGIGLMRTPAKARGRSWG